MIIVAKASSKHRQKNNEWLKSTGLVLIMVGQKIEPGNTRYLLERILEDIYANRDLISPNDLNVNSSATLTRSCVKVFRKYYDVLNEKQSR
jgi:hypothetical protein